MPARRASALLLLLVVLAGCSGKPGGPADGGDAANDGLGGGGSADGADGGPGSGGGGGDGGDGGDGTGGNAPVGNVTASGATTYRLADGLSYTEQLRRFALVAEGPVTLDLDVGAAPNSVDRPSNCLAVAAELRLGGERPVAGLYFVAWAGDAGTGTEAVVAGQRVEVVPEVVPDGGAAITGATVDGDATFGLEEGDVVLLQVGGRQPMAEADLSVDLLVVGPARLVELPPAPLACGRGLRDAEGSTLGLATYIVTTSVGGELAFESREASTLLAQRVGLHDESAIEVEFPGQATAPFDEEVALTAAQPGRMALRIERDVDEAGSLAWFFADTTWPLDPSA